MPITASIAPPSVIAGSTVTGEQPKVTRMEVPGIKGADGDITWQDEWSSATTYTQNEAVQYNGSAYVCLQGNSNIIPSSDTDTWSVMTSKGDTGADGSSATISIGTVTTVASGNSATVTNSGTSSAATFNFNLPRGSKGAPGNLSWQGAWNSGTTYYRLDVVYYSGGSYTALSTNTNIAPTTTTTWDIIALAGAAGGTIEGMADTNVAESISDAAILMYNDTSSKWEDNNVFGTNRTALRLDGGTF